MRARAGACSGPSTVRVYFGSRTEHYLHGKWALQSCNVSRTQFLWLSVANNVAAGKRRVKCPLARGLSKGLRQQCAAHSDSSDECVPRNDAPAGIAHSSF